MLVIGAGVAGLVAAIEMRRAGYSSITIVEKADRLGGTWRENTYPGVACDVPSHLYSYSFAPNPNWSHTFAPGDEILSYLEAVAADHGVADQIRYGTEILRLEYDGPTWTAHTSTGDVIDAEIVLAATGVLHHPSYPEIEGLDSFSGPCFHSARWDHDVDLRGARLGIIGAGSTAVQITTAVVDQVGHLELFQRTPQWVLPVPNDPVDDDERRRLTRDPGAIAERRAHLAEVFEAAFADVVVDAGSPQLDVIQQLCLDNIDQNIADPELRERLRPDHRAACKRLVVSPGYYQAVAKSNVSVTTDAIERIEATGVRTADGHLHELDVLVLATGFRVDRFLRPIDVVGRDGRSLDEVWRDRPSAYLGMSVPDFPNLFLLNGPNGPVGNFSLIEVAELQVAYLRQLLEPVRTGEVGAVVATAEAADVFEEERTEAAKRTVWVTGCRSWYLDDRGIPAAWPWTFGHYRKTLAAPDPAAYEFIAS